jgi:hypothetical protein
MKKILPFLVAAVIASPAAAADRSYTITDFDRVEVSGPFQVSLTTNKSPSAKVSGATQAIEQITIENEGRTLRIHPNHSAWGGDADAGAGPLKIEIATHDLRAASVTGAGTLVIDQAKGLRIDLTLAGGGRLGLANVQADTLFATLVGSGTMTLGGTAKDFHTIVRGTGDLDAKALTAIDATVESQSAGSVTVNARNSAKVNAGGTGDVTIVGNPACTVKAFGSGRVSCGK